METTVQSSRKSVKENSILAIITNQKLINAICLIVIISSAFLLYRRIVFNWVASQEEVNTVSYLHGLSMGVPFYCLVFMYFVLWFPKVKLVTFLDRIINIKWIAPISIISIVICIVLFVFQVPAVLATWTSIAILIAGLLMGYSLLKDKIPNTIAVFGAIGIIGMWVGFWEIPYQIALKLVYDLPQVGTDMAIRWIIWEILVEVPMCGCGLWIIIELNKKYHIIEYNKKFWILISTYAALTIIWITSGFWVDVWYNWKDNIWVATSNWDKTSMFIYKASKAIMLIAFISLICNKNRSKNNEINLS